MIHFEKANGFTLIEVLVALVILSIALLSLAGLMATTTKNNAAGGHLTEAATLAQDMLERIRLIPLSTLSGAFPADTPQTDYPPPGSTGISYTRSWTYNMVYVPSSNDYLETITVTVSWVDPGPHSITMVSAFTD